MSKILAFPMVALIAGFAFVHKKDLVMFVTRRFACATALSLLAASLSTAAMAQETIKKEPVQVVVSFTVLADIVRQVGGAHVKITSLIGANQDAHHFEPSPADAKKVAQADVVVINGINFEEWADRLVRAANFKGERCVASKGITALSVGGGADPHAWQDPANIKLYAKNIAASLSAAAPHFAAEFSANAERYSEQLTQLDQEIRGLLAGIPREQRKIITAHHAFTYFGEAYGVDFYAPQGVSTHSEASAKQVGALIRQIKEQNIRAVFVEKTTNRKTIDQISRETGVRVGGSLYTGALPAGVSYIDMMRHNAQTMVNALR